MALDNVRCGNCGASIDGDLMQLSVGLCISCEISRQRANYTRKAVLMLTHEKEQATGERDKALREKEQAIREKQQATREKYEAIQREQQAIQREQQAMHEKEEATREKDEALRREQQAIREKEDAVREKDEALRREQQATLDTTTAAAAWEVAFAPLVRNATTSVLGGDKLVMPAEYFLFGQTKAFMDGLPGMLEGGLLHSMAEEARCNEGGKWWAEFAYVVERVAEEDVADLPSTAKFKGKHSVSGELIVRDRGHGGMTLARFCEHEMAKAAELTPAEVAAIRLYSGPMFEPINYALRTERIADWATTIACCYSGVLKLSFLSQPARVYRGVRESERQLPPEFLNRKEGKFAGGVERTFMSTTKSAAVALDYSGGPATIGSIFVIDFDVNSRGASIQWLSQYPHEEELLFPPCTGLACLNVSQQGQKRCIRVNAQVSTARLDTSEVETPHSVPGTKVALSWVAEQLRCSVEELICKEDWDLSNNRFLSDPELLSRLTLLLGRASLAVANLRSVNLNYCGLGSEEAKAIVLALMVNTSVTKILVGRNRLGDKGAAGAAILCNSLRESKVTKVQELDLSFNDISPNGAKAVAAMAAVVASITHIGEGGLDLRGNNLGDEGWGAIFAGVCSSKVSKITSIDASRKGIGPEGAKLIAEALRTSVTPSPVTSLSTAYNKITGDGAQQLASAVLAKPTLENFSGIPLKELRTDSLTMLDLSYEGLGVPEAMVLADLLRSVTTSLTSLDLSGNVGPWSSDGLAFAKALAPGIAASASLTKILVGYNQLGDEGATTLCNALRKSTVTKVQELSLKGNQIGPEGAKAVAAMAAVVGSRLDARENSLGEEGEAALHKAIQGRSGFELLL